jgi:GAF domain-containing protein
VILVLDPEVGAALSEAARKVGHSTSVEEMLETIVHTAQLSLPGFEHVGISTIDSRGRVHTRAQTSELVKELDDLQYGLGEGPCVDTLRTTHVVEAPHIRHDQRWPRYVPAAVALGLKSQFAVQLYLDDEGTMGGLNIYSTSSEDIDEEAPVIADLFATQAALALGRVRQLTNLNVAMTSREVIGKAIGMIMVTYQVDQQTAFGFLARVSSTSNVKMRDLAAHMLAEHEQTVHSMN